MKVDGALPFISARRIKPMGSLSWVKYDLTRPHRKGWFMWGIAPQPPYFRLVKYYNSPRLSPFAQQNQPPSTRPSDLWLASQASDGFRGFQAEFGCLKPGVEYLLPGLAKETVFVFSTFFPPDFFAGFPPFPICWDDHWGEPLYV